ncbi:MAG: hypothetical protein GX822_08895 [Alcaligenaceae bacterium]|nr:hypothetical protein [Alcaligenaceae bacterium]
MGIFSFLSKNDAKIVAKNISEVFKKVNGDYGIAYATIANHWIKYNKGLRNRESLLLASTNQLPNLAMLAVAEINGILAKRNTSMQESKDAHYEAVVAYLKKQKIPPQYIDGDNLEASQKAAEAIQKILKEKGIEV